MVDLFLHGNKVDSVFQLLGEQENDITYSVAWALTRCPSFLREFLRKAIGWTADPKGIKIRLQQYEASGFTDIEIEYRDQFYVIIEAKRGWQLPARKQLEKYARRQSFTTSKAPLKRLVVLSECSREYGELNLEVHNVDGVPVEAVSWKEMAGLAISAQAEGSHAEKRLLQQLLTYLRGLMTMQNIDSNWVYVVSVAQGTPKGWGISWIDIVKKRSRYFHSVGGSGWPKEPPNYIAFRYYGKLQAIHHIESYEIVTNMHTRINEIPDEEWGPNFLYSLGPAFGPDHEVRTGNIYRNGRVWCMLDTLLTCKTISEARDRSKLRIRT